jgi:hypothetical protein
MDTSRVSPGQLIAAAGGAVLIISLFLDWISGVTIQIGAATVSGGGGNAFDVFSGMDIILLLIGISALAIAALSAAEASISSPVDPAWMVGALGLVAFGWCLGWDLENGSAGIGAWLGLIASGAIVFGAYETIGETRAAMARSSSAPEPTGSSAARTG